MSKRTFAAFASGLVVVAWADAQPARAQVPTDYLVQMVCVDSSNTPIFADPVSCPSSRRKLQVGEPLPYHKIDTGNYQISDSFPLASTSGQTLAANSYFFTQDYNIDSLFSNQPHYTWRGGYNIMGSDSSYVFFRGTGDSGTYWAPWWTAGCETRGWRLFPNTSSAFSYGWDYSDTEFAPDCPGSISVNGSIVEWNRYSTYTYVVSTSDPTKNRTLDTLASYHWVYSNGAFGDLEISFFTQEYGFTRWESWRQTAPGSALATSLLTRCPGMSHTDTFHGSIYYLNDCRNWTTLIQPSGGAWDPDGASSSDPLVLRWPVDPLYTSINYLQNTHIGGPYPAAPKGTCADTGWAVFNSPAPITLGYYSGTAASQPYEGGGNCVRTMEISTFPAGDYYQVIPAPPGVGTTYKFGAMLWTVNPSSATGAVNIVIMQRDSSATIVDQTAITANLTDQPRVFQSAFVRHANAADIVFAYYPQTTGVRVAATGAYIAP